MRNNATPLWFAATLLAASLAVVRGGCAYDEAACADYCAFAFCSTCQSCRTARGPAPEIVRPALFGAPVRPLLETIPVG